MKGSRWDIFYQKGEQKKKVGHFWQESKKRNQISLSFCKVNARYKKYAAIMLPPYYICSIFYERNLERFLIGFSFR